ncbi:MAG: hypothetical protein Q7R73_04770 [bacterium]|nr:hypothetical protein [bacterium]
MPCDIATIGLEFPDRKEDLEKKLKANIVYGMVGTPSIYNAKYLSGVEKHYANYKEKYELLHTKPAQEMKEEKQEARKDATILADELTEWYEKNVRPREE